MTWSNTPRKPSWQVINVKGSYNFCPYSYTPRGIQLIALYSQSDVPISLKSRSSLSGILFARLITLTMLPSMSENRILMTYNPQRLLRHFSFNQGAVCVLRENCIDFGKQSPVMWELVKTYCWGALPLFLSIVWLWKVSDL